MFQKHSSRSNREDSNGSSKPDRTEEKPKNEKSSKKSGGTNVILSDVEIKGTVTFKNDVVIDGKIDGEIHSDGSITIGEKASVNAEIRSRNVVVEGCVNGDIHASDRLELAENAQVTGDITAAVLSMKAGAVLVGTSSIGSPPSRDDRDRDRDRERDQDQGRDRKAGRERDRAMSHA